MSMAEPGRRPEPPSLTIPPTLGADFALPSLTSPALLPFSLLLGSPTTQLGGAELIAFGAPSLGVLPPASGRAGFAFGRSAFSPAPPPPPGGVALAAAPEAAKRSARKRVPKSPAWVGDEEEEAEEAAEASDGSDEEAPKRRKKTSGPSPSRAPAALRAAAASAAGFEAVVVETESVDSDVLEDGWRWRKYGQKFVRGSTLPRSYYKCTTPNCPMRKHCERSAATPAVIVSTYEGAHNHTRPAVVAPRGHAPPRVTSPALRAAAAACSVRGGMAEGAPAPMQRVSPPKAAATGFRKPPALTIPVAGEAAGALVDPLTSYGRMPLSAVLRGADGDMLEASLTLLGSAKGAGNMPFGSRRDAPGATPGALGAGPTPGAGEALAAAHFFDLTSPGAAL